MSDIISLDKQIKRLLEGADDGFANGTYVPIDDWSRMVYCVLKAHELYRTNVGMKRYDLALEVLAEGDPKNDWIVAAREWLERRRNLFFSKFV